MANYINQRLHEVPAWNGESNMMPPGSDYVFKVAGCATKNNNKGNPQLELDLECLGPSPETVGRTTKAWYQLADNKGSRGRLRAIVDACGVQLDANGGFDADHLVGRTFMADCIADSYEKSNPATGVSEVKTTVRVQNERPMQMQQSMGAPQQYQQVPQQQYQQVPQGGGMPQQYQGGAPQQQPTYGPPNSQGRGPLTTVR